MSVSNIDSELKDHQSTLDSLERILKNSNIENEMLNSEEAQRQMQKNLMRTQEISLDTENMLWKYRALIKNLQS